MAIEQKMCGMCKEFFPLTDEYFYKTRKVKLAAENNKPLKVSYNARCKACERIRKREFIPCNREAYNITDEHRQRMKNNAEYILSHLYLDKVQVRRITGQRPWPFKGGWKHEK